MVGLLGPNGSGKTTIMKSITGLAQPTEGKITVFGAPAADRERALAKVGALIEQPALYENLTAQDHLAMAARYYRDVDRARMDQVLEIVGLAPYKKERCGKFSLGMKQRMGLALALLSRPELMVLDEPTNGLDIEATVEIREIIIRLAREKGVTFLVASHLASEIEKMCHKVLVLHEGGDALLRHQGGGPAPAPLPGGLFPGQGPGQKGQRDPVRRRPMEQFLANLSNELFKLRKRKKYLVFLVLGCVVCVVSALRVLLVNFLTDGGVDPEAVLGNLMSSNLTFVLLIFLPLMAVMAASDLFVSEQADHTIRFALMRPVGKGKLFFSKALAVFVLCAVDLGVMYLVTTLAQVALGGGTAGILTSLGACLLDLIPLAVLILFFCLLNQVGRGSGLTCCCAWFVTSVSWCW